MEPDPAFYLNADADPDPKSQINADPALQLDFLHLCVIFSRKRKLSYIFVVLLIPEPESCA
jgi:hypothetical protein